MKKLIWFLALAIIGYVAYTQFVTPLSEEAKEVKQLEKRFNAASTDYVRAVRTASEIAAVGLPAAEDAIRVIKDVKTNLDRLKKRLKEEDAISRAEKLAVKIKEFYRQNDLL
jgi:5'-deoxynucleotidase YfbR-like HD superfamily hydrolase